MPRPAFKASGFGTLAVLSAVLFVSGLAVAWSGPFLYRNIRERIITERFEESQSLRIEVSKVLDDLSHGTSGDPQAMLSKSLPEGFHLIDLSASLNPRWVDSEFISSVASTLKLDADSIDLSQKTMDGLALRSAILKNAAAAQGMFSDDSPLNADTVDDTAFSLLMGSIDIGGVSGTTWTDRLHGKRGGARVFSELAEAESFFGIWWNAMRRFTTIEAPVNANTADPQLLKAIMSSSMFKVHDVENKTKAILDARSSHFLGRDELRSLVGLPAENPIWRWLGTSSRFWKLEVQKNKRQGLRVVFRTCWQDEDGKVFEILREEPFHG